MAGIIAAEADGAGTVGVAFGATIAGVNMIDGTAGAGADDLSAYEAAMMHMTAFDVVNHSWGAVPGFEPDLPPPSDLFGTTLPTFENAAVNGRGGLGTVLVKSAGNAFANSQGDLIDGSRFSITVAATAASGAAAPYTNYGANVLVSAPSSGNALLDPGILTTDRLGAEGYTGGDYTGTDGLTGFGGTSAAAPIVSGVAALMLEAAPGLGWREVQSILARTATTSYGEEPTLDSWLFGSISGMRDSEWLVNGASDWNGGGMHFSADFGYGLVNAHAAVRMAEVWHLFDTAQTSANEIHHGEASADATAIGTGLTIDLDLGGVAMDVEHVEVSLDLSDPTVDVFLVSASGTRVQLYDAADATTTPLHGRSGRTRSAARAPRERGASSS